MPLLIRIWVRIGNNPFTLRGRPVVRAAEPGAARTPPRLAAYLKCVSFWKQAPALRLVGSGGRRKEDKTKSW